MLGTYGREMAAVCCKYFGRVEPLCCRNDRRIDKPQIQIRVFPQHCGGSGHVLEFEGLDDELAVSYCPHKGSFCLLGDSRV